MLVAHFSGIYGVTESLTTEKMLLQLKLEVRIASLSEYQQRYLNTDFTPEDVQRLQNALFQMSTIKALGPDGVPALCYKILWHIMDLLPGCYTDKSSDVHSTRLTVVGNPTCSSNR